MKDEYSKFLLERFPQFFQGFTTRYPTYAHKQFCIGDGWYGLLFDMLAAINRILDNNDKRKITVDVLQIKEKFGTFRFYYITKIENESWLSKTFRKVDEFVRTYMCKWGYHKIYWKLYRWRIKYLYGTLYEKVAAEVGYAEASSAKVCEICGGEGKRCSPNGWIAVLCEKHEKERQEDE